MDALLTNEEGIQMPQSSGRRLAVDQGASNDHPAAIACWLEAMTRQYYAILAKKDYAHTSPEGLEFRRYVAPDYLAYNDNFVMPLTYDEHVAAYAELAKQPGHELRATSVTAQVEDSKAVVFVGLSLKGLLNMRYLVMQCWRREEGGQWMLWQFKAMRAAQYWT